MRSHVTSPWSHRPRTFRVARVPPGVSLTLSFCGAASAHACFLRQAPQAFLVGGSPSTKFHEPGMHQVSWHLWAHRTVLPLGTGKEEEVGETGCIPMQPPKSDVKPSPPTPEISPLDFLPQNLHQESGFRDRGRCLSLQNTDWKALGWFSNNHHYQVIR